MNASYRPGIVIVLATLLAALALCLVKTPAAPSEGSAARDLGNGGWPLGRFRLVERSGRTVTDTDLSGGVWVADFIFTRCPLSCPRITSVMKGLQGKLGGTGVRLVSISVDPEHDTPAVLTDYADRFGADPDRWWFLTGPRADVLDLITGRFKLGVQVNDEPAREAGAEAFSHSDRLALVDRGRVLGFYSSTDPGDVAALVDRARRLDRGAPPAWAKRLPHVNAALNATCAALLTLGWLLVRAGNRRGHAAVMIACVVVSALFLTCYLVYHAQVGSVPFRGTGPVRVVYFTVLLSHTLLAAVVGPLVGLTLFRASRRSFAKHVRIARLTLPIWLYVSVTGVIIYLMLYRMPVRGGYVPPGAAASRAEKPWDGPRAPVAPAVDRVRQGG